MVYPVTNLGSISSVSSGPVEYIEDKVEYGLGLALAHINDRNLIGHGGGFPGHITKSYYDPKDQLTVIVLTNCRGSNAEDFAKETIRVFDYLSAKIKTKNPELDKYEGRYANFWDKFNMISLGDKLICADLESNEPFKFPEVLEPAGVDTFKIIAADSYSAEGELVRFKMDRQGKVESINYAGATSFPEKVFLEKTSPKIHNSFS